MIESKFQSELKETIESIFPGCIVLKNDPNYLQGFPDLTILFPNGRWAVLECKRDQDASHQPNQDYYVEWAMRCSYGSFIFPENQEVIINELQRAFQS